MIGIRISETRRGPFSPGHRLNLWPWSAAEHEFGSRSTLPPRPFLSAAKEPKPGSGMVDDESGIGIIGDTVNQVEKDAPPFKPTIVDDEGNVVDGDPDAEGA